MSEKMHIRALVAGFNFTFGERGRGSSALIQALSAKYLVEHEGSFDKMIIDVPEEVDHDVATRKLAFLGKKIDVLTPEQEAYLNSSSVG